MKNIDIEKSKEYFLSVLKEMPEFKKVKFVFLFGSIIYGKPTKSSDVDFAVYYEGNDNERFKFRLKLSEKLPDKFDIQIFQDLPLYIRKEVLKGKVIYVKDKKFVYEKAYETIQAFEDFKFGYYDYLENRKLTIKNEK